MEHLTTQTLFILLAFCLLASIFFALAETSMMTLNRYRLRHLARQHNARAKRVLKLIERPDRLLGIILICDTFANVFTAAIATVIIVRNWGEGSVGVGTIILTFIILIFGEIAPKTVGALHPMRIALFISASISILLRLLYPVVWLVNALSNLFLRLFGVRVSKSTQETLTSEELRSIVYETGSVIPTAHKNMLLSILDLEKITVDDVMSPRNEIVGIDLSENLQEIVEKITGSSEFYLPVFSENIENIVGVVTSQDLVRLQSNNKIDKETLRLAAHAPYYIPEGTPLNRQLLNFRDENQRCGLVVDEYGTITGLVTLESILEEIVGDIAFPGVQIEDPIQEIGGNKYLVDGSVTVREINKKLSWTLPTRGPKTLSGLIIERLEFIPVAHFCLQVNKYQIEVVKMQGNKVKKLKINSV